MGGRRQHESRAAPSQTGATSEHATTLGPSLPRGRSPDRAGVYEDSPVSGVGGVRSMRGGGAATTDLPRNDRGAGAVTIEQANAPAVGGPAVGGPAGRGVRASDLNGPGVLPAGAVRQARNKRALDGLQPLHRLTDRAKSSIRPGVQNGGQAASPPGHLTPSKLERAAPAGGECGSHPHWWTGCQIERWCNGRRYVGRELLAGLRQATCWRRRGRDDEEA